MNRVEFKSKAKTRIKDKIGVLLLVSTATSDGSADVEKLPRLNSPIVNKTHDSSVGSFLFW